MAVKTAAQRMPAYFLVHGGGPMPLLGDPGHKEMIQHLKTLAKDLPQQPRAIVMVSSHWETKKPTVNSAQRHELIYDYAMGSWAPEAFEIKYPAPSDPGLARHVIDLLRAGGIDAAEDDTRGWDHGVFVPLALAFPAADLPIVELSVLRSMDPEAHLHIGEALAPLRDDGVLVLGSGSSFHNMKATRAARHYAKSNAPANPEVESATKKSEVFDAALTAALTDAAHTPEQRRSALVRWAELPEARFAHPREEHLLPLHVVAGAASCGVATADYSGMLMGAKISAFKFA